MELIKRDTVKARLSEYARSVDKTDTFGARLRQIVDEQPTADVDPVVHCRECENSYESVGGRICAYGVCVDCVVPEDFFCQYGERRASDGE